MTDYDQSYIERQTVQRDVIRPIRNALKLQVNLLDEVRSVVAFGFGDAWYLQRLAKKIPTVFGYEINETAIDNARKAGYNVQRQSIATDIVEPFDVVDLAICDYVFEHLSDGQVKKACHNMMRSAPINVITLTTIDDPHYETDSTHCNGKNAAEWSSFLGHIYKEKKWKRIFSKKAKYCFMSPMTFTIYNQTIKQINSQKAFYGRQMMPSSVKK